MCEVCPSIYLFQLSMKIVQSCCYVLQVYEHWPHRLQRRLVARVNSTPSAAQVHQQQRVGLTTVGCPSAVGLNTARGAWTAVALGVGTGCTRRSRVQRQLTSARVGGAVAVHSHLLRLYVRGHGLLAVAVAGSRAWPWAPGCGYSRQPCVAMGCVFVSG